MYEIQLLLNLKKIKKRNWKLKNYNKKNKKSFKLKWIMRKGISRELKLK